VSSVAGALLSGLASAVNASPGIPSSYLVRVKAEASVWSDRLGRQPSAITLPLNQ
jgi:hypothetical protein